MDIGKPRSLDGSARNDLNAIIRSGSIFSAVPGVRLLPTDPSIYCHTCIPGEAVRNLGALAQYTYCGGAGFSEEASWVAAAAEGLERYCAVRFSEEAPYTYSAWSEISNDAVGPESWITYSKEQTGLDMFPCQPFDAGMKLKWYPGTKLGSESPCLLPGPMVCFPYKRCKDEVRIFAGTSTGLAFGSSYENAARAGLWEVIERDAVTLAWSWGLPATCIRSDVGLPRQIVETAELGSEYSVHLYDITSDIGIPACMSFLLYDGPFGPQIAVGAAARGTIQAALEKAILESMQGVPYVRYLCQTLGKWNPYGEFAQIRSFRHSAAFYSLFPWQLSRYRAERGDFLVVDGERVIRRLEADAGLGIAESLAAVERLGYSAYTVDMTAALGVTDGCAVVRTVVPGLYGLEGSYRLRSGDSTRARASAHERQCTLSPSVFPHPMP